MHHCHRGVVPRSFRASPILPVLKKPNLDPNDFGNYRPIANLPFVSKVLERIVADQLMCYVDSHNLLPANQSAYRNFHSTETALLKVFNRYTPCCWQGWWGRSASSGLLCGVWHAWPHRATPASCKGLLHHRDCSPMDWIIPARPYTEGNNQWDLLCSIHS